MRRKGLEPSQDELPLEPESSASAIPPSPLTKSILSQDTRECKYFFEKIKKNLAKKCRKRKKKISGRQCVRFRNRFASRI